VRYHVRNAAGEELIVPSLDDLHALYAQGFLSDDDLVRGETSDRWRPAGTMKALQGVRARRTEPRRMGLLLIAATAVALAIALQLAR
jgi:hypothetical protein